MIMIEEVKSYLYLYLTLNNLGVDEAIFSNSIITFNTTRCLSFLRKLQWKLSMVKL